MFSALQKLLPTRVADFNLNQYFIERQLKKAWQKAISQKKFLATSNLKPVYFRNGTLFLAGADSCLASELRFQENKLCQMVNAGLSRPMVSKIKFLSYWLTFKKQKALPSSAFCFLKRFLVEVVF